jgi:hypothetical protein
MEPRKNSIVETSAGPVDLGQVVTIVEESGTVSPPVLARAFKFTLPQAESALLDLAKRHYLEFLPESGLIPTYRLTRDAYATVEASRSGKSILSALFPHHAVS